MQIRIYTPRDREQCVAIFESNCPQYFMPDELPDFEKWLNGRNNNRLAYGNTAAEYFFVLEENDIVVACGGFYITKEEPRGNMVWGMVHSLHHKKGYGTALFRHRQEIIRHLLPEGRITIDTSQYTYGFFEKMGFKVTTITENGYGEGLHRYDMV